MIVDSFNESLYVWQCLAIHILPWRMGDSAGTGDSIEPMHALSPAQFKKNEAWVGNEKPALR